MRGHYGRWVEAEKKSKETPVLLRHARSKPRTDGSVRCIECDPDL